MAGTTGAEKVSLTEDAVRGTAPGAVHPGGSLREHGVRAFLDRGGAGHHSRNSVYLSYDGLGDKGKTGSY